MHNNLANALRHAGQPTGRPPPLPARPGAQARLPAGPCTTSACFFATPGPEEDLVAAREHLRRRGRPPARASPPAWLELGPARRAREGKLPAAIENSKKVLELNSSRGGRSDRPRRPLPGHAREPPPRPTLLERGRWVCLRAGPPPPPQLAALANFNLAQVLGELGESKGWRPPAAQGPGARSGRHPQPASDRQSRTRPLRLGRLGGDPPAPWPLSTRAAIAQAPAPFLLNLYPVPAAVHRAVAPAVFAPLRHRPRAGELGGRLPPVAAMPRRRSCGSATSRPTSATIRSATSTTASSPRSTVPPLQSARLLAGTRRRRGDRGAAPRPARLSAATPAGATGRSRSRSVTTASTSSSTSPATPPIKSRQSSPSAGGAAALQRLHFVNTMADFILDYQIADRVVVGPAQQVFVGGPLIFLPAMVLT